MPNSDNAYGLHNKQSMEIKIVNEADASDIKPQSFSSNVSTAQGYFFTDAALACFNDNATQISWAITSDGKGLSCTIAFGVPASTDVADSWAKKFSDTKTSLISGNNFVKASALYVDGKGAENADGSGADGTDSKWIWKISESGDHLF